MNEQQTMCVATDDQDDREVRPPRSPHRWRRHDGGPGTALAAACGAHERTCYAVVGASKGDRR
jgi:hypothetical protein